MWEKTQVVFFKSGTYFNFLRAAFLERCVMRCKRWPNITSIGTSNEILNLKLSIFFNTSTDLTQNRKCSETYRQKASLAFCLLLSLYINKHSFPNSKAIHQSIAAEREREMNCCPHSFYSVAAMARVMFDWISLGQSRLQWFELSCVCQPERPGNASLHNRGQIVHLRRRNNHISCRDIIRHIKLLEDICQTCPWKHLVVQFAFGCITLLFSNPRETF